MQNVVELGRTCRERRKVGVGVKPERGRGPGSRQNWKEEGDTDMAVKSEDNGDTAVIQLEV